MADDLTLPAYPEVEARRRLSKKQKAEVILRQHGRCAGCGIKPKAWEFDHDKALWKGETDQANLDTWVAYGSRKDCDCHLRKTSAEAGERAKMKRVRSDTERHATRMKAKATLSREVFKRERRAEAKIQSRNTLSLPLEGVELRDRGKMGGGVWRPKNFKHKWPKQKFGRSIRKASR